MNNVINKIEKLLKKPYYVIDFLPCCVPENSKGQFFDVEKYYLKSIKELHKKFDDIILKLNCYYDLELVIGDKSVVNPKPSEVVKYINSKDYINILFDKSLITIDKDDSHITAYNANKKVASILKSLATSNGLFMWR